MQFTRLDAARSLILANPPFRVGRTTPPDWRWALAPAYDVTHAYNPRGDWTFQHLMSVKGRFADITTRDLLVVADRNAVPKAKATLR